MKRIIAYVFLVGILSTTNAALIKTNEQISIKWGLPTVNEDGTPVSDLKETVIYYSTISRVYTSDDILAVISATTSSPSSLMIETFSFLHTLGDGLFYVAATARDYSGNESVFSPEFKIDVRTAPHSTQLKMMKVTDSFGVTRVYLVFPSKKGKKYDIFKSIELTNGWQKIQRIIATNDMQMISIDTNGPLPAFYKVGNVYEPVGDE